MTTNFTQFLQRLAKKGIISILAFFLVFSFSMGFFPSDLQTVYAAEEKLYLDGVHGDDENDGSSEDAPLKTFEKAKELAGENQNISVIYIVNTIEADGYMSLDGTNAILKRNPGFSGYLLKVSSRAELSLENITIDGGGENDKKTRQSLIYLKGNLNILDGTVLQNNHLSNPDSCDVFGGAIYSAYSENDHVINMIGGTIQNNSAYCGGGVLLFDHSIFNMSGGEIINNTAFAGKTDNGVPFVSGGGIAAFRNATINLSDNALIRGNRSEEIGGGIALGTITDVSKGSTLNMTGGTISDNTAGSAGGGIYVQAGTGEGYSVANISKGDIINNAMTGKGLGNKAFGGGGIYVNGQALIDEKNPGILNLSNALITDNYADVAGGGYASCPTSKTEIHVKSGSAIFGNRAQKEKASHDIYIESGYAYGFAHSGNPKYAISPFMLGGTPYYWKSEDNQELPINKLNGILDGDQHEVLKLHTDVWEDNEALSLADVIISGNYSATRGGGIGSNGTVNTGEKKITKVKVSKIWKYDNPETRPESITVELYRLEDSDPSTPTYIGAESMTELDGKWEITFTNLPKLDENDIPYRYIVKESGAEGYSSKITGNQNTGYQILNIPGVDLTVEKKWEGESAREVEIKLLADGATKEKVLLTEADEWKHSFNNLAKFDANDGHEIEYNIAEVELAGYTSSISGDTKSGFIVTNTKLVTPPKPDPKPEPSPEPKPDPTPPGPTPTTPTNPRPVPSTPSNPGPAPTPSPTPTPNPGPTPTVAGESRPTPDSEEVVESEDNPIPPIPAVLGESRTPEISNKRNTPTGDKSLMLVWAELLGISSLAFIFYLSSKLIKYRR